MPSSGRSARWLGAYYFLYFATVGITLPFLPGYFVGLGLSATQSGILLSLSPLLSLVAPPLFGRWADLTGRRERVLLIVTAGSLLAWAPLSTVHTFAACAAVMAGYACFSSSIVPLVDSLTLEQVIRTGGSYAHVRLFGSVGFIVASVGFGAWAARATRATVLVPLVLFALAVGVGLLLPRAERASRSERPAPWRPDRELLLLLAASCLHWIACAPYNGTFILHLTALGLPGWVVGVSAASGVAAEVGVMALYPRLSLRFRPRTLLAAAFLVSALRWVGMALAVRAGAVVALTVLHGLTFGLFYVAAVDAFSRRVPAARRASGQALFVAVTFGLGGLAGYLGAGAGFDWLGGARLFGVAAAVELLALGLVLALRPGTAGGLNVAAPGPSERA
jgi:PPP family 3-phenylpropionic acid transporter